MVVLLCDVLTERGQDNSFDGVTCLVVPWLLGPAGKEVRPAAGTEEESEDSHHMAESMSTGSPLKRLSAKPPAVGTSLSSSHR